MKIEYLVMSPILQDGKTHGVGTRITLTPEQAAEFGDSVKSVSLANAQKLAAGVNTDALVARIDALLAENKAQKEQIVSLEEQLQQHQESLATLLDDHEKIFGDYKQQITDLQAENEQLKAAAAKPAKGK